MKGGLFESLGMDIDSLLSNQEAIFRYLLIRKRLASANNNSLPFLDLPAEKLEVNQARINQREFESLGLYVSYFSR